TLLTASLYWSGYSLAYCSRSALVPGSFHRSATRTVPKANESPGMKARSAGRAAFGGASSLAATSFPSGRPTRAAAPTRATTPHARRRRDGGPVNTAFVMAIPLLTREPRRSQGPTHDGSGRG